MRNKIKTACGGVIVIPRKAEEHLRAHPEVAELLPEAIGRVRLPSGGEFLATEVEMGRVVGRSGCVATPRIGLHDPATFARRIGRDNFSRVVLDAAGPETTTVVVLAFPAREERGTYVLVSSWIGTLAEKEPWDLSLRTPEEVQRSRDFWTTHALVHDPEVMGKVYWMSWAKVLGE